MVGDEAQTVRAVKRRSTFFLVAASLMTLIVFLGFLPSFYLRSQFRTEPLPAYLIVHGLIMTAWQLLFLAQTVLIARRRADLHRKLGYAGAGVAVAVVASGLQATLLQPSRLASAGVTLPFPIELLIVGNLFGFVVFAGFVAAAVLRRRDAQMHKRLIFWACVVTMGPALTPARSLGETIAPYFPATIPPEVALVWIGWIALLLHDWRSSRSFHPVSVAGGFVILLVQFAVVDWLVVIPAVQGWVQSLA